MIGARPLRAAFALLCLLALPAQTGGDPVLVPEVSQKEVQVRQGFTGTELLLFGAVIDPVGGDEGFDVIVVLKGPAQPIQLREKRQIGGIWMNAESTAFRSAPSYFAVASSRPIDQIVDARTAAIFEFGTEFIQLSPSGSIDLEEQARMRAGLVDLRERQGLYRTIEDGVTVREGVLYQARIGLPSNVQTGEERRNARDVLDESEKVLQNMKREDGMDAALEQAKGVFLVPDFGRGAFVFGGRGGQGVVLAKDGGDWNGPAFFNFGAVSAGAQGGVAAGEVAMLLMTDKAVKSFKQDHNFALNADAGLTLVDWSKVTQGSYGKGDVLFWSSTEGLFAGGAISVSDVFSDDEANQEYYTRATSAEAILEGEVEDDSEDADALKTQLP